MTRASNVKKVIAERVVKSVAEQVKRPVDLLTILQGAVEVKPKRPIKVSVEFDSPYRARTIVEYIPKAEKRPQHIVVKEREGVFEDTTGFDPDAPGAMERAPPAIVYEYPRLPVDRNWIDYAAEHDLGTNSFEMIGGTSPYELATRRENNDSDYLYLLN